MFDTEDKVLTVLGEAVVKKVVKEEDDQIAYVVDLVDGDRYVVTEDEILGSVHE